MDQAITVGGVLWFLLGVLGVAGAIAAFVFTLWVMAQQFKH